MNDFGFSVDLFSSLRESFQTYAECELHWFKQFIEAMLNK